MLTEKERQTAIHLLTETRALLVDAVDGVTDAQAKWKPEPDRWSILEYVEHLAVADDGLVALVRRILLTPAKHETAEERAEREKKIRSTSIPRGANPAPHALHPNHRFATLAEALEGFLAARVRTLEFAQSTRDDLRGHFATHPVLGEVDGFQWLVGNARHVTTHVEHIREIRAMPEFPAAAAA